jgi:hypothetical protein
VSKHARQGERIDAPATTHELGDLGAHLEPTPAPAPEPAPQAAEETVAPTPLPESTAPGREVTCPECGTVARVAVNRRESHDFCATCDFPLFWTPNAVVLGDPDLRAQASLRRLPGTAGRQSVGSLACPSCAEANPITNVLCLRCGADLHPVAAPPPPAPEPLRLPEPEPVPEPEPSRWWLWVLATVTLFLLVAVVVVLVQTNR